MTKQAPLHAPIAAQHPYVREFHGRSFVDNYEWLRDKESQETLDYLDAENAYTASRTAHLETLTENIFQEVKSRVKETDMSVPTRRGNYWYYGRSIEGKSYGISCRVPVKDGSDRWTPPVIPVSGAPEGEEILLDLNELAAGYEFFALGASTVSDSGNLLAYSVDYAGDERFALRVKNLVTGRLLEDCLEGLSYGVTWVGEDYLFYSTVDDAWRADTIWRHRLGTPQSEDVIVFKEDDERFNVGIGATRSEKYLIISLGSKTTTESWILEQDNPEGQFRVLWPREDGVDYDVDHAVVGAQDYWVVTHNATGANFEVGIAAADAAALPALTDLKVLLPHKEDQRVEGVDVYRDQIVFGYRRGGIGRCALMDVRDGWGTLRELEFSEELYAAGIGGNPEWDAPVLRLSYTSFLQPGQLFDLDVHTGQRTLLKEQEVPGGYEKSQYVAYRLWSTAADGTQIPVSVVHRADLDTTKPNPALLYGYGSYEASIDPHFSVFRLSLMDRGMVYVIAHVRGGGEMGRGWYEHGKLGEKMNTFTDFIAVADDLIACGITSPDRLVAEGGSAGGLLMGAVANLAPDRFCAIQASVPFVDPLTSILKPELPLTVPEWEEWGDPYHDPEVYDYMKSYSPYENVCAQDYPDILALTSLNDTRVLYVEPAKWIAALRATATGGEFLLKTEMVAGHGGVSGRYEKWRQSAFECAWIINKATGRTE